jgi:hypothetical protein
MVFYPHKDDMSFTSLRSLSSDLIEFSAQIYRPSFRENERFGIVFATTGSVNSGTAHIDLKTDTIFVFASDSAYTQYQRNWICLILILSNSTYTQYKLKSIPRILSIS